MWDPGEELMADRLFTIEDYLSLLGVKLVSPSFLKGRGQITEEEVITSQQIANERIHVERMTQRLQMIGSLNQIITVYVLLCTFQEPIIRGALTFKVSDYFHLVR